MPKWLDLLFQIAAAYKAGEIDDFECRDRIAAVLERVKAAS